MDRKLFATRADSLAAPGHSHVIPNTDLFAVESAAKYLGISLPLFSCVGLSLSSPAECAEDDITPSAIRS